jgi:hypothetical protein
MLNNSVKIGDRKILPLSHFLQMSPVYLYLVGFLLFTSSGIFQSLLYGATAGPRSDNGSHYEGPTHGVVAGEQKYAQDQHCRARGAVKKRKQAFSRAKQGYKIRGKESTIFLRLRITLQT